MFVPGYFCTQPEDIDAVLQQLNAAVENLNVRGSGYVLDRTLKFVVVIIIVNQPLWVVLSEKSYAAVLNFSRHQKLLGVYPPRAHL